MIWGYPYFWKHPCHLLVGTCSTQPERFADLDDGILRLAKGHSSLVVGSGTNIRIVNIYIYIYIYYIYTYIYYIYIHIYTIYIRIFIILVKCYTVHKELTKHIRVEYNKTNMIILAKNIQTSKYTCIVSGKHRNTFLHLPGDST